jgi:hypothetical protein
LHKFFWGNALAKNQAADPDELAIALALPFVGRFACFVPGDILTHTKLGGILDPIVKTTESQK